MTQVARRLEPGYLQRSTSFSPEFQAQLAALDERWLHWDSLMITLEGKSDAISRLAHQLAQAELTQVVGEILRAHQNHLATSLSEA